MSKRLVVIESPYSGDVISNVEYAKAAIRDSLSRGECPIASHLLYTQEGLLDDTDPVQRVLGIEAGHNWIPKADLVVVYADRGLSAGMQQGIHYALKHSIPVEYRYIDLQYVEVKETVNA